MLEADKICEVHKDITELLVFLIFLQLAFCLLCYLKKWTA